MALLNPGLFCQAPVARQLASVSANTDVVLQLATAASINTAITSQLYSATQSVSGKTAIDIQTTMNLLKNLGYTVSLSGTTLTISW